MSIPSFPDFLDLELFMPRAPVGTVVCRQQRSLDFWDAIVARVDHNEIACQIAAGEVTGLDRLFFDGTFSLTPTQWAHRNGHFELATFIEKALKKIRDEYDRSNGGIVQIDREVFLQAIRDGNFSQVMDVMRRGIRDDHERRALVEGLDVAANIFLHNGSCEVRDVQLDIIRLLIVNKVRPSFQAIYALIFSNSPNVDRYLYMITEFYRNIFDINRGGYDINQQFGGNTLLIMAIINGNEILVNDLLNYGANPEARDNLNYTPLMHAAKHGKSRILRKLLECGVDIEAKGSDEATAETLALYPTIVDMIRQVRFNSLFKK